MILQRDNFAERKFIVYKEQKIIMKWINHNEWIDRFTRRTL